MKGVTNSYLTKAFFCAQTNAPQFQARQWF
jgi:hypothetical protein